MMMKTAVLLPEPDNYSVNITVIYVLKPVISVVG